MLRPLATPVTVTTKYGTPITLTHELWVIVIGHELVETRRQRGVVVAGAFVPFESEPIEAARIEGADLAELLATNDAGKPADTLRTEDIIAKHQAILERDRDRLAADLARRAADRAKSEAEDAAVKARLGLGLPA